MKMNKKIIGLVLASMLSISVIGCGNEKIEEQPQIQLEQEQEEQEVYEKTEKQNASIGKRNALKSAESYLKYSGFSEQGLRRQLEYEGYTDEEIDYAMANVEVDWNEECVETAESYLKYSSFSEQGLRNQLEYEGFSDSQIDYAMEKVWR